MKPGSPPTAPTVPSRRFNSPLADCPQSGCPVGLSRPVPAVPAPESESDYDVPPPRPPSTSLDSIETSVRGDFDRFMAEKGTPVDYFALPAFDDKSLSTCFRHSGWMATRSRVWQSMERCGVSKARRSAFGLCGSYAWVERSVEHPEKFRLRANHCNDRLCIPCARQRAAAIRQSVLDLAAPARAPSASSR